MELSKNLQLNEVTNSPTAKALGISNQPTEAHIANLKLLATKIFQPIRDHFGKPIRVSSGYRSAALNAKTPGASKTSQHSTGEAFDLDQDGTTTGITNRDVFYYIKDNLQFDQLIWEFGDTENPAWVHVSYESTGKQRGMILEAYKVGKTTKYRAWDKTKFDK